MRARVDTGCTLPLTLPENALKHFHLVTKLKPTAIQTFNGMVEASNHSVDYEIKLGDPARPQATRQLKEIRSANGYPCVFGMPLISQYTLSVDHGEGRFTLESESEDDDADEE
ncbi:hypothetical protein PTSG_07331 [Salpingoeca rosetta]|uniref:Uncharacterized protein n=1 Tax=Salpingoeca rosetta (strain ATCC 50818 / BSB-021) TaxID=946362 RepID=F2UJ40_SALR5|nr:uncharacterized protein PTSG_07331 [Salpingoeca rosetta]EGD76988.1 hypothetical protein PTSG_07331 [Salpingoeca rosetta]|eukprot:XP_004990828.1 hypothetical protein PTSG_07331 [Salpingoeca rosetta]